MVLICEVLVATGAATLFTSGVVLSIELANVQHRNVITSLMTIFQDVGFVICGVLASYARHFRFYLRLLYVPTLISCLFVFFASESLRWLLINGKRDRTMRFIEVATKMNDRELSAKSMEIIDQKLDAVRQTAKDQKNIEDSANRDTLKTLLSSRVLLMRLCTCGFCWITVGYVTQAVSIISVFLDGDPYFNFSFTALGALPSVVIAIPLLKYVGRRKSMAICLLLVSVACVTGQLLPDEYHFYSLTLYLIARCFCVLVYLILYLQASELWPTSLRQTITGLCATFGKVGAILAPLSPLLVSSTFSRIHYYVCVT